MLIQFINRIHEISDPFINFGFSGKLINGLIGSLDVSRNFWLIVKRVDSVLTSSIPNPQN